MTQGIISIEFIAIGLATMAFLVLAALGSVALARRARRGGSLRVQRLLRGHRGIVEALVAGREDQRPNLVARLREFGNMKDIEVLLDGAAESGQLTAEALRFYYDASGVTSHYIEMLETASAWKRRAFAASKLGLIGSVNAIPQLLAIVRDVKDEDEDVRRAALRALGRIRDESSIPFLIEALGYPETWLPPRIAEILVGFGEPVIEPLIAELRNLESESRRVWAADILGCLEARTALLQLIDALSDISPEVRARAVGALGKLGNEAALGKLLELLVAEPVPFVRIRISQALGAIGHPMVVDHLISMLKDPEWWVRVRAVEALEHLGDKAVPALLVALEDEDFEVRRRSAMTLERVGYIGKTLDEFGEDEYRPDLHRVLMAVVRTGVLESIRQRLVKSTGALQKNIVRILGEAEVKEAAGPLIELLEHTDDWTLKARLIQSLGMIGAREAIPCFIDCLKDPQYWVRMSAVESLGHLQATEAAAAILSILDDPNPFARQSALGALAMLEITESRDRIEALLLDTAPEVRTEAIRAMGELDFPIERSVGRMLLADPADTVRVQAVAHFARHADAELLPDVMRLLPRGSKSLRREIVSYLREIGARNFEELMNHLGRAQLSDEALVPLVEIAAHCTDPAAAKFVTKVTKHEDPRLRAAAFAVLGDVAGRGFSAVIKRGLADPAVEVRVAVLTTMARKPLESSYERAIELAKDPDEDVRLTLALSLGAAGMTQHAPTLTRLLDDESKRVIAGAMMSLASLEEHVLQDIIYSKFDVREIRAATAEIQQDGRFDALIEAIQKLAAGASSLEVSLLLAHDKASFSQDLNRILKGDRDPDYRIRALEILHIIAAEEAFITILGILKRDPSQAVRQRAMEFLAASEQREEAVQALASMLVDPALAVRARAADLLGRIQTPESIEILLQVLDSSDREFREAVTTSLSRLLQEAPDKFADLVRRIPASKTKKIGMAWLMGKTRKRGATKFLLSLLQDGDRDVRAAAIGALAKFRRRQLLKHLEKTIYDPDEHVRAAAMNAIAAIGGPRAMDLLEKALEDVDGYVRIRATVGLAQLDPTQAVEALGEKSQHLDELESYRLGVMFATGQSYEASVAEDKRAKKVVAELCPETDMRTCLQNSTDQNERLHAIRVLSLSNERSARKLIRAALKDPSPQVREEARQHVSG